MEPKLVGGVEGQPLGAHSPHSATQSKELLLHSDSGSQVSDENEGKAKDVYLSHYQESLVVT